MSWRNEIGETPQSMRHPLATRMTLQLPHAVFYGFMGWISEWRRRRVLQKHSIDAALWRRATRTLPFVPQTQKLKDLLLLFLGEKQFAGAHGVEVPDEMRVGARELLLRKKQ